MITFQVPKKPSMANYNITNSDIDDVVRLKENFKSKERNFNNKNDKVSYWIGFIVLTIIGGALFTSIEPDVNPIAIIVFALIVGVLGMIPIGIIISIIAKNIGDNFAPVYHVEEERLNNAEKYLKALKDYNNQIEALKRRYPRIEEVNFNEVEYNKLMSNYFYGRMKEMVKNTHVDTLRKLYDLKTKCLSNLHILGLKDIERLKQSTFLYKGIYDNKVYLVCYERRITPEVIKTITQDSSLIQHDYILFITEEYWRKDAWYYPTMLKNKILPIKIDAFERLAHLEAQKDGFSITYNSNNTPLEHWDIDYIDYTRSVYGGSKYRGFTIQVIKEVFSTKKEVCELILKLPTSKGTYGIIQYPTTSKDAKSVYGLAFFKMGGEIHYFMRYFTAAISDDRKEYSNIVNDHRKMRNDCGEYWYSGWSSIKYFSGE